MCEHEPVLYVEAHSEFCGDCDCACSPIPFSLDVKPTSESSYTAVANLFSEEIRPGYYVVFSPFAPSGPSLVNESAWHRLQQFQAEPQKLEIPFDRQLADQHLLLPGNELPRHNPTDPETLVAWIHVTNACNLDCPYCYVRKSTMHMTEEVGYAAVDQIVASARNNGFRAIKLKYAGGEATMHFSLVQKLHSYAHELAQANELEIEEVLLSNGVGIKPAMADWIQEEGVKLMISIDGIGEVHDVQRPTKRGTGSFKFIEKSIQEVLLPRHVSPEISVTVTALNAPYVGDTVRWILEQGLSFNLNFYRENQGSKKHLELKLEEKTIIEGLRAGYEVIEEYLPSKPFLNGLLDKINTQAHTHTCGVGQSYIVVGHTGIVSQCQMHLETKVGHIKKDTPHLMQDLAHGPIQNLSVDEKEGCKSCVFRYRCTGGCPIETFRATGRWDVQSPHCNIYKTLFPEALRLEGLRLLKVNGLLPEN